VGAPVVVGEGDVGGEGGRAGWLAGGVDWMASMVRLCK